MKSDPKGSNWKQRWLVCDATKQTLMWYIHDPRLTLIKFKVTDQPKGSVSLKAATLTLVKDYDKLDERARGKLPTKFGMVLHTVDPRRDTIFCVRDAEAEAAWAEYIKFAAVGFSGRLAAQARWALLAREMSKTRVRMDAPAVRKEGMLLKSTREMHHWTVRRFVLEPSERRLTWFDKKKEKGFIDLTNAEVSVGHTEPTFRLMPIFSIRVPSRTYYFCADDMESLQDWLDAVQAAVRVAGLWMKAQRTATAQAHSGWMQKCNTDGTRWARRFFRLDPGSSSLSYFASDAEGEAAKGVISLSFAKIHMGTSAVPTPTRFVIVLRCGEGEYARTYYLCTRTYLELQTWYDMLLAVPSVQAASREADDGPRMDATTMAKAQMLSMFKSKHRLR